MDFTKDHLKQIHKVRLFYNLDQYLLKSYHLLIYNGLVVIVIGAFKRLMEAKRDLLTQKGKPQK